MSHWEVTEEQIHLQSAMPQMWQVCSIHPHISEKCSINKFESEKTYEFRYVKWQYLDINLYQQDFWSQPVYRDQFNHLWKDTELGRQLPAMFTRS